MGYSRRARLTVLGGAGAMAVTLIMMLSPAAAAASANLVITAKYHGAVSPSNSVSTYGCATAKLVKSWAFHLKTGLGGWSSTGKAAQCKKVVNGVGVSGNANAGGGFSVAIPFKAPSSITNVTANAVVKMTGAMKATDGVASNTMPPPSCTNGLTTFSYHYISYDWNATFVNTSWGGYWYFPNYNYSDWYNSTTYSYYYAYGNGAIPSPFNLNNTTSFYESKGFGASSYCQAYISMYSYTNVNVVDMTSGSYMYPTWENSPNYQSMFVEVYTAISWSCSYYFSWYGPTNSTYGSTSYTCYNGNTTLTSIVSSYKYTYYPVFSYNSSYSTGTNNTQVVSLSGVTAPSWSFAGTYNGTHKYVLMISTQTYVYGSDSWKKGYISWTINEATLGNGWKLSNITLT